MTMIKTTSTLVFSCLLTAATLGCSAESSEPGVVADELAQLDAVEKAGNGQTIKVKSPSFKPGGALPPEYTCEGKPFAQGYSPELYWSKGPTGTNSFAIVFRDTSIADPNFSYHYAVWNIPKDIRHFPEGITGAESPPAPLPASLGGAQHAQARNVERFFGPCPSWLVACTGDDADRSNDSYEFRVYAFADAEIEVPEHDAAINPNYVHRLSEMFEAMDLNKDPAILTATSDAAPTAIPFPCPE